ncbi:hypothetical protein AB0M20_35170, partial [Actinoplanes sp. NPDC051633]
MNWRLPVTIGVTVLAVAGGGLGIALADESAGESISCPEVASRLPAIPARAQAEVDRNLALLETQLAEAERRLVTTKGQGGPNFVQNAILGPLKDKRGATIDRIAIAIGRSAEKPQGLESLAACSLSDEAAPPESEEPAAPPAEEEEPAAPPLRRWAA